MGERPSWRATTPGTHGVGCSIRSTSNTSAILATTATAARCGLVLSARTWTSRSLLKLFSEARILDLGVVAQERAFSAQFVAGRGVVGKEPNLAGLVRIPLGPPGTTKS